MFRSAAEPQFEIIGEAISQLSRIDLDTVSQIEGYQRIVAFRNILIHGYAQVDGRIVWGLLQTRLPELYRRAKALLEGDRERNTITQHSMIDAKYIGVTQLVQGGRRDGPGIGEPHHVQWQL
jgi:uncharacterized protein with HEPN domain